jgi:hypothetical protein
MGAGTRRAETQRVKAVVLPQRIARIFFGRSRIKTEDLILIIVHDDKQVPLVVLGPAERWSVILGVVRATRNRFDLNSQALTVLVCDKVERSVRRLAPVDIVSL